MSNPALRTVELTGVSDKGFEDAVKNAMDPAMTKINKQGWYRVIETRARTEREPVHRWQVTVKVGYMADMV